MKRYVDYFEKIEAPVGLTSRLEGLEARRRPFPVYRVAALAAALALAVGVGAAARRGSSPTFETPHGAADAPTIVTPSPDPDVSPDPGPAPGPDIGKSDAGNKLPELTFADTSGLPTVAADYWLGVWDGSQREATEDDMVLIFGTASYRQRLGLTEEAGLYGTVYFTPEGLLNGMSMTLEPEGQPLMTLELLRGYDVPSCGVVLPYDSYGVTEVDGVKVTALDMGEQKEVKLFIDGFGWKLTCRGDGSEELAARFVALVLDSGAGLEDVQYEYPSPEEQPGEELPAADPAE